MFGYGDYGIDYFASEKKSMLFAKEVNEMTATDKPICNLTGKAIVKVLTLTSVNLPYLFMHKCNKSISFTLACLSIFDDLSITTKGIDK